MGTKLEPKILYSLSCFAFQNRESKEETYRLFNAWVRENNVIFNGEEARWSLNYIRLIKECDPDDFKKALEIDKKRLKL